MTDLVRFAAFLAPLLALGSCAATFACFLGASGCVYDWAGAALLFTGGAILTSGRGER